MRNLVLTTIIGLIAAGCASVNEDHSNTSVDSRAQVTGTLLFRERIILRPGTVAKINLLETSRADALATELANQVIENPNAPPIPFSLGYDGVIDERYSYSVRATVSRGGRLLLTTDQNYPVLTRGAGNSVDLMLVAPSSAESIPGASLENTYWKLVKIGKVPYQHATANREPHIQFGKQEGLLSGFTGCNNIRGGTDNLT